MAVAERAHIPARHRAVVAVVAYASTRVEVGTQHGGIGTHAHAKVMPRHVAIGVMHQSVADVFHVDIVRLATVVTTARAFCRAYAYALAEPVGIGRHVTLVIDHLGHVVLHVGHALHGKTAHEDLGVIVRAFELSQPDVGASAIRQFRRDVVVVAHKQHIAQVLIGVVVVAEDVRFDLVDIIAANVTEVDHSRWPTRLVFPGHEGLHGSKIG